ncbi:hypothetical protein G7Z17_g5004 [Cylindrodendrum hubeiense]|uniref:Uncharacterized protein n=1 Tax=Cylindrodendrum hubeiense TaxID=595255 RepID=A0A9P5HCW0_9HYPO|nr:hypothetical protein G7Z17_g5004 [Cylindrodendrum hubeiense]
MANFARSLKPPYLSPRLRPSMPGRTVSSSSDLSTNSPLSEDFADVASSGRNTPTLPTTTDPRPGRVLGHRRRWIPRRLHPSCTPDRGAPRLGAATTQLTTCRQAVQSPQPIARQRSWRMPRVRVVDSHASNGPSSGCSSRFLLIFPSIRLAGRSDGPFCGHLPNWPARSSGPSPAGINYPTQQWRGSGPISPARPFSDAASAAHMSLFRFLPSMRHLLISHIFPLSVSPFTSSFPNTPLINNHSYLASSSWPYQRLTCSLLVDDYDTASATSSRPSTPRTQSNNGSNPIAIELPQHRRFGTAPTRTPPEPLSARGDLPGGYFPLHEDPNTRVHRPHPFQAHHEARMARHQAMSLVADRPTSHPAQGLSISQSNTPVASFLPAGFHDSPLPVGKYYPSNYEQRNTSQTSLRPSFSGSLASTSTSDSDGTLRPPDRSHIATPESEIQRKLQQYQRDMIAQASMAANELLGSSTSSEAKLGTGRAFGSMRIREARFTAPTPLKPMSPKLLPLGSPGPVTPMTLESASGCYLSIKRVDGVREEGFGASGGL